MKFLTYTGMSRTTIHTALPWHGGGTRAGCQPSLALDQTRIRVMEEPLALEAERAGAYICAKCFRTGELPSQADARVAEVQALVADMDTQAKLRRQRAHGNANPACVVMDGVSAASCIAMAAATAPKRFTMSWANPDGSKGSPSKHWSNLSLADAGRCFNARLADKHRAALDALAVGQCYTDFDGDYWERVQ